MIAYGMGTPPLSGTSGPITPALLNHGMLIKIGQESLSNEYNDLDNLMVQGPPWGYILEPTKIILVVSPQKVPREESLLRG